MRRSQDFMAPTILTPYSGSDDRQQRNKEERATGFEPATPSLGSWHSTAELCPLSAGRFKFSRRPLFYGLSQVFSTASFLEAW